MWQFEITVKRWFGFGPWRAHRNGYREWYFKLGPVCFRVLRYVGAERYMEYRSRIERCIAVGDFDGAVAR